MATRVQYLGGRETQIDTLFGSGCVWQGHGDVQVVENDNLAKEMDRLTMGLTYKVVGEGTDRKIPDPKSPEDKAAIDPETARTIYEPSLDREVPIDEASRAALVLKAEELGLRVEDHWTRDELLDHVLDYWQLVENPKLQSAETQLPGEIDEAEDYIKLIAARFAELDLDSPPTVAEVRELNIDGISAFKVRKPMVREAFQRSILMKAEQQAEDSRRARTSGRRGCRSGVVGWERSL